MDTGQVCGSSASVECVDLLEASTHTNCSESALNRLPRPGMPRRLRTGSDTVERWQVLLLQGACSTLLLSCALWIVSSVAAIHGAVLHVQQWTRSAANSSIARSDVVQVSTAAADVMRGCTRESFPYAVNAVQCIGLRSADAGDEDDCARACCAANGVASGSCTVWQYGWSSCWIGIADAASCRKPDSNWVGRSSVHIVAAATPLNRVNR